MKRRQSRGMALVIVLALATGLLVMGISYISQVRQRTAVNPNQLTSIQAEFLGQGIAQIAAFKVKKMTGPFYYAMIAKNAPTPYSDPYDVYIGDSCLQGSFSTPFSATFQTTLEMFSSKVYRNLNFRILVLVQLTGPNNVVYQRQVEQIYNGEMSQL